MKKWLMEVVKDGSGVTKKNLRQWMLKITAYADRLLEDLDQLDWPEKVKNATGLDWKAMVQKLILQ